MWKALIPRTSRPSGESGSRSPQPETLASRIAALAPDERAILETLLRRMEVGRTQYGPWNVADSRDYPAEAMQEVLDALHYCAAALVRIGRKGHK